MGICRWIPQTLRKRYAGLGRSDCSSGLLEMLAESEEMKEQMKHLKPISFALTTRAATRPTGYRGYNIPGYYDYEDT